MCALDAILHDLSNFTDRPKPYNSKGKPCSGSLFRTPPVIPRVFRACYYFPLPLEAVEQVQERSSVQFLVFDIARFKQRGISKG